jgi:DNA-binding transcriptional LysR family regulator
MDGTERIERRLKLHDLRVLMSVVEKGSMAKAAAFLATSQPAVSRAIADLENSLCVRLLDRGPRGIAPTPYGRALIKRGIAIFDELKQGVQDIEFLADPTAGEVRIAAPIGYASGFVAAVIDRLARRYPRIVCHLTVRDWPVTTGALEQRDADLAITRVVTPLPEDHLQAEVLFADSLFVIAAIGNPWARRRRIGLADLMNEPWALAPPENLAQSWVVDAFRAAGLELPRATMVTTTGAARIALVAKGRFLAIASSVLRFGGWESAIKILPIALATSPGAVGIVTLKNRTLTPVAQLFIDCSREVAKPLATGKSVSARRRQLQEK